MVGYRGAFSNILRGDGRICHDFGKKGARAAKKLSQKKSWSAGTALVGGKYDEGGGDGRMMR